MSGTDLDTASVEAFITILVGIVLAVYGIGLVVKRQRQRRRPRRR